MEKAEPKPNDSWLSGTCNDCGFPVVVTQPDEDRNVLRKLDVLADYQWYCSNRKCGKHIGTQHTGDMEVPDWVTYDPKALVPKGKVIIKEAFRVHFAPKISVMAGTKEAESLEALMLSWAKDLKEWQEVALLTNCPVCKGQRREVPLLIKVLDKMVSDFIDHHKPSEGFDGKKYKGYPAALLLLSQYKDGKLLKLPEELNF